uniref:C3H1-type domain-containing protein n=1 Tax=Oryza glumipatula TaxID=40148 RepID=A0A0E0AK04_9ORYZ
MADSEDGDHAATTTTEQRYDDDGHLVPSSGGQEEEGSGGRDVVVPGGHVAEDYRSGVGVPVGRDAGGATSSPPQPVHVTPSILVGSIHAPVFQGELVGMKFGVGSGSMGAGTSATRRLPATGFGALPTSSMAEDSADHADDDHLAEEEEEEEEHYIDDGPLVPSSGGQEEEGSGGRHVFVPGGHDGEEDHPDDLVADLDLDLLVDGVVGPVPGGHLNADAPAFVPTTRGRQDLYSALSSSAPAAGYRYRHYITSSALAEAGHVSPFLGLPYATAFDSPLDRELVGPSSAPPPCSAASRAWLVRCSSPLSDSEWTRRSILAREAANTPASTVTGRGRFEFVPIPGAPYAPPPSFAPIAAGAGPAARPLQQLAFGLEEHKTKLCAEYYSRGLGCPRGNTCKYAHGEDDLRLVVAVGSLADAGEGSSSSDSSSAALGGEDKYKTKLCKTFTSGGLCLFAANCRFAHGEVELGKKEPCWYFFSGQTCPRGDTCGFRHSY